jgi:hypothetical protein
MINIIHCSDDMAFQITTNVKVIGVLLYFSATAKIKESDKINEYLQPTDLE